MRERVGMWKIVFDGECDDAKKKKKEKCDEMAIFRVSVTESVRPCFFSLLRPFSLSL